MVNNVLDHKFPVEVRFFNLPQFKKLTFPNPGCGCNKATIILTTRIMQAGLIKTQNNLMLTKL